MNPDLSRRNFIKLSLATLSGCGLSPLIMGCTANQVVAAVNAEPDDTFTATLNTTLDAGNNGTGTFSAATYTDVTADIKALAWGSTADQVITAVNREETFTASRNDSLDENHEGDGGNAQRADPLRSPADGRDGGAAELRHGADDHDSEQHPPPGGPHGESE